MRASETSLRALLPQRSHNKPRWYALVRISPAHMSCVGPLRSFSSDCHFNCASQGPLQKCAKNTRRGSEEALAALVRASRLFKHPALEGHAATARTRGCAADGSSWCCFGTWQPRGPLAKGAWPGRPTSNTQQKHRATSTSRHQTIVADSLGLARDGWGRGPPGSKRA